jgi:membrane-associated phospholipid phosphatase
VLHNQGAMNDLIIFAAQYLLYVMAGIFVLAWLIGEDHRGKLRVAAASAIGLGIAGALILLAGLHTDLRPFVQDPSLHPLVAHSTDNGFPSDHSIAAAMIAELGVWRWPRSVGAALSIAAVLVAVARVAAHLHHVQDVAAGLGIGVLAALVGISVTALAGPLFPVDKKRPRSHH